MLFRRALLPAVRRPSAVFVRAVSNVPAATATEAAATTPAVPEGSESLEVAERARHSQAPNRATTWSKSQRPKEQAMVGPRFEQTNISQQPAPWAAIELIHQQPVRWSEKRVVCCDGGGGPNGHPRVYINVDKPEVTPCGYCGLPFAHVKNKKYLQEVGSDYPLE
ncbi:zinc-finger domain-containing protein [Pyronema omphalodes]|nr:zinc-finger domain-containing protein [Pyronema omphalodes]